MDKQTDYTKSTASGKRIFSRTVIYLLLTLWALIVLFPFYWMLLTSVKSYSSYNAEHIPSFFTLAPTLQNYKDAFTAVPLGKYLLNTLLFTTATTAIMMVVITLSAFAFARLDFRGKNLAFTLFLSLMMIPICKPTIVTIAILKVIECWNSYVWPRLITDDENYYLVSNGIQEIRENGFGRENIPAMMAAVVVISLPLIILFLIFRNKIMAGVSRGGTKG